MGLAFFPETQERLERPSAAIVEQDITSTQKGWVYWQGTSWSARFYNANCQETVTVKQLVMVVGIEGNTLLIVPTESDAFQSIESRRSEIRGAIQAASNLLQKLAAMLSDLFP